MQEPGLTTSGLPLIEGLISVGRTLATPGPLVGRLEHLCGVVAGLIGCDRSSIFVLDGKTYRGLANFGSPPDVALLFANHRVSQRDPLIAEAARSGSMVVVNDALNSDLMNRETAELARIKAIVVAPISSRDGAPIGFLTAEYSQSPGAFDDVTSHLVLGFASLAAGAIEADQASRERALAEERLAEREHRLAESQRVAGIGSWSLELPSFELTWSDEAYRVYGVTPESFVPSEEAFLELIHPDDRGTMEEWTRACLAGENPTVLEFRAIRPDGSIRIISGRGELQMDGANPVRVIGTAQDITARRQAEDRVQRLGQLYATLSECNRAIVHSASEGELFSQVCRAAVDLGGMTMAWIGLVDEATRRVTPAASYGQGLEYLEGIEVSVDAEDRFGRGPTGTAIRGNQPYWCDDFQFDQALAPWHERASRFGFRASAALPLLRDGVPIGSLNLYASTIDTFDADARALWLEIAHDISFALDNFAREVRRKQAEEAQSASELRYRRLFEAARDGILILDAETGAVVEVNPFLVELLGYSREAFLGKMVWELGFLNDTIGNLEQFIELKRIGYVRYEHLPLKTADGQRIDVEFVSNIYRAGGLDVVQCNIRDITARKLAEEAREASERKFLLHIENTPVAVIEWDPRFRVTSWNLAAEQIFGYSAAEAMGQHANIIIPEGARHLVDAVFAELLTLSGGQHSTNQNITKDGRSVVCEWFNTPLTSADGTVIGVASLVQDVTERERAKESLRESEERYRLLFDESPDGIILVDLETGKTIEANARAYIQLGYTRDEFAAMSISDYEAMDTPEMIASRMRTIQRDGHDSFSSVNRTKSGELIDVHVNVKTIQLNGRRLFYAIVRDITERKRAENALRESEERYRLLFDESPYAIAIYQDGGIVSANRSAWLQMGAESVDDLIGLPIRAVVHPDRWAAAQERIGRMLRGETGLYPVEDRFVRLDGTEVPVETTVRAMLLRGPPGYPGNHARHHRTETPRGAVSAGPEDGGRGPTCGRHRPRLQQSPQRHHWHGLSRC